MAPSRATVKVIQVWAGHYDEVSLANWLAHLPPKLVSAQPNIPWDDQSK